MKHRISPSYDIKNATRFVRFYRSTHAKGMHLHKPWIPWPSMYMWQRYRNTLTWNCVIFLQIANHRSRQGKLLPTRQTCGPVSDLSDPHFEWKLLWSMCATAVAKKPREQSEVSFALIIRVSTCDSFTRAYTYTY